MMNLNKLSWFPAVLLLFAFMANQVIHCGKLSSSSAMMDRRMKELDKLEDVLSETNKMLDVLKNEGLFRFIMYLPYVCILCNS